ncbi:MAG: type II toxin-antitoxin system RelB/DinJ family antitoxin [Hungatella sp.]|jgi:addiction module RelB/DinJ family antitoxin|nr:type II toxin-antitoxin system RelB/DinJ family antitoxin [Hungatella sp.]
MARTSNVFARVEPEVKKQAEQVFSKLGIPMSNAVEIFLRQVIISGGFPFDVRIPREKPIAYGTLSKEEFDMELEKGMEDIREGKVFTADEVEAEMKKEYGI